MMTIAIHRKLPAPARQHARREPLHDQRGQSAVEITLLLPLLLVLLFGILLSGFTFYAFIQVSNAAREGARAGSEYRITQASNNWASLNDPVRKAIYDTSASPEEMGNYCLWRGSGAYLPLDPLRLLGGLP